MSDQMSFNNPVEPEKVSDTFHDRDTLIGLATKANGISWLFLILTIIVGFINLVFVFWWITGKLQLLQFLLYFVTALVPLLLSGFFWVASQFLSEGVYLLMDIEDNLHPKSKTE